MRNRKRSMTASVLLLSLWVMGNAAPLNETVNRHTADEQREDSLAAALPFLMDKVQSTIEGASSEPVSFYGEVQFRGQWHNYTDLADSSYLLLTKSGVKLGGDDPVIKLGLVGRPGRNTILWASAAINASFYGTNTDEFLNSNGLGGDTAYSVSPVHHARNKGFAMYEDLSAGIAIRTRKVGFNLAMGSMNWIEASPLSIWKAQPRVFAWQYLPYEIEQPIARYYEYNVARGEKQGQAAWNKKAFQGVNFTIENMPGDVGGFFSFGAGMPFDKFERNHMDMAVDMGYAADEGTIVEAGIGDTYRKKMYYRLSKKIDNNITIGFNNGYIFASDDVVNAGYKYENSWNTKFDVGRYNSTWQLTNGSTVKVVDSASYSQVAADAGARTTSLGIGYHIEPKTFSVDGRGKVGKHWSFLADVGVAFVDTTWLTMDTFVHPDNQTLIHDINANIWETYGSAYPYPATGTQAVAIPIQSTSTSRSDVGAAAFVNVQYEAPLTVGLDLLYASKDFYSPYSFINPVDAYWAMGSNLLGVGNFVNSTEASPYAKNMMAAEVTLSPQLPWYGHLRLKYGLNRQIEDGQDLVYLPYRLNGHQFHSTLNEWYSKWGLGTLTETYDFNNNQGVGADPNTGLGQDSLSKHPLYRLGDQSYSGAGSQVNGGLRADANALYEGFVPFSNPTDVIFNWFSASPVVSTSRDLSTIWDRDAQRFVDRRSAVDSILIVSGRDSSYYSLNGDTLTIEQNGSVVSTGVVETQSATGFVPQSTKRSFHLALDWAVDIGKYIDYSNDFFMSLYYEVSGVTSKVKPFAFNSEDEDVVLLSHYIRTEPVFAITEKFYVIGLFGWETWLSDKSWSPLVDNNVVVGFKESDLRTNDISWGLGFDWDMLKRVSLHTRYTWFSHKDEQLAFNNYLGHAVALEIKAFF